MNGTWSYSYDEERYHGKFDSRNEAIETGRQGADGDSFFIAKNKEVDIAKRFDLTSVLEDIEEAIYDEELNFTEDTIIEVDDKDYLEKAIRTLIKENCFSKYYTVYDVEVINEEEVDE